MTKRAAFALPLPELGVFHIGWKPSIESHGALGNKKLQEWMSARNELI
jgi:hypothetical protein